MHGRLRRRDLSRRLRRHLRSSSSPTKRSPAAAPSIPHATVRSTTTRGGRWRCSSRRRSVCSERSDHPNASPPGAADRIDFPAVSGYGSSESSGPSVVVIGGGFSGTAIAAQLLRRGRPVRVLLVNRYGPIGRGVAYRTRIEAHVLNVPAGGMSALPSDPSDFLRFAAARDPGVGPGTFVSRRLYGEYLEHVLRSAEAAAAPGAILERVVGEVRDIAPGAEGGASVVFRRRIPARRGLRGARARQLLAGGSAGGRRRVLRLGPVRARSLGARGARPDRRKRIRPDARHRPDDDGHRHGPGRPRRAAPAACRVAPRPSAARARRRFRRHPADPRSRGGACPHRGAGCVRSGAPPDPATTGAA